METHLLCKSGQTKRTPLAPKLVVNNAPPLHLPTARTLNLNSCPRPLEPHLRQAGNQTKILLKQTITEYPSQPTLKLPISSPPPSTMKGPTPEQHDGTSLRIGIVHARWNAEIIDPLLDGTKAKLLACGVPEGNIVVESVPGSWELPIGVQRCVQSPFRPPAFPPSVPPSRDCPPFHAPTPPPPGPKTNKQLTPGPPNPRRLYAASQIQSSSSSGVGSAGDLLGGSTTDLTALSGSGSGPTSSSSSTAAFDAIIAIGVLIKGETMHFEYIADSVSHGLMRVQLDTGVPVVFGVLTVLSEDQAKARAGVAAGSHNHGEDWGLAAVEMGVKRKGWASGKVASP